MLWTIFLVILLLWMVCMVGGYTMGGFIHVLLVVGALVLLLIAVMGDRPPV